MARQNGVILRDYDHPQRAVLAAQMAALCRTQGRAFWVAGDIGLATHLSAGFHCPSYLITRRPQFALTLPLPSTAAVHNMRQIKQAAEAGFTTVILSPAFPTDSHRGQPALGVLRFMTLARAAAERGLRVYALGGMTDNNWKRLSGGHDVLSGYAAISHFNSHSRSHNRSHSR